MKHIDYRFWLKTALPTIGLLAVLAVAAVPLADRLTKTWFIRDLSIRAQLVANSLIEDIGEPLSEQPTGRLNRQLNRLVKDERLYAIGFCDLSGKITQSSSTFIRSYDCKTESGAELASPEGMPLHVDTIPVTTDDGTTRGTVVVLHDTSFIGRRSVQTQSYIFVALFGGSLLVALITLITTELVRRQWFTRLRQGSCTNAGRITLNPELVCASRNCIDYVIFHELCHIKEHNHGPSFYKFLKKVCPTWENDKEALETSMEIRSL